MCRAIQMAPLFSRRVLIFKRSEIMAADLGTLIHLIRGMKVTAMASQVCRNFRDMPSRKDLKWNYTLFIAWASANDLLQRGGCLVAVSLRVPLWKIGGGRSAP